ADFVEDGARDLSLYGLAKPRLVVTLYKKGEETRQILDDLIKHTDWGDTEIVVIDLPAGSGDELHSVISSVGDDLLGVVLVTLPVTYDDCIRVIELCTRNRIPILGMIENMAGARTMDGKRVLVEGEDREFYPLGFGQDAYTGDWNTDMEEVANNAGITFLGKIPLIEGMFGKIMSGDPEIPEHSIEAIDHAVEAIVSAVDKRKGEHDLDVDIEEEVEL
ncbi:MAG: P-loop NTPase, partial [Candidatus Thermoplasmatota archaeon]|nr:P-loop NTPase [Candidatus Thermoplasmatota archaeon]